MSLVRKLRTTPKQVRNKTPRTNKVRGKAGWNRNRPTQLSLAQQGPSPVLNLGGPGSGGTLLGRGSATDATSLQDSFVCQGRTLAAWLEHRFAFIVHVITSR